MGFLILWSNTIMNTAQSKSQERKITLMIIGAQKAGTTSLKNYLGQHPELETHPHKEFAYFFDTTEYNNNFENARKKYFSKEKTATKLIAKNAGLYVNESGIIRLKEHNPRCKLVLLLRNPIERTYSSFLMEKNYGAIDSPFESMEPILKKQDITDWRYEFLVGMGLYEKHLRNIYKYFPVPQVKLIRYEDFEKNGAKICSKIYEWIGVDAGFATDTSTRFNETTVTRSFTYGKFISRMLRNKNPVKKIFQKILPGKMDYKVGEILRNINHKKKTYGPISSEMASLLRDFFEPHNNRLSELTGMDFSDWNKKL